jgi:hypothetical protein
MILLAWFSMVPPLGCGARFIGFHHSRHDGDERQKPEGKMEAMVMRQVFPTSDHWLPAPD